jgi:hypothetical protein
LAETSQPVSGDGMFLARAAQLFRQLSADEGVVTPQPCDDDAVAVADSRVPLLRQVLAFHRRQEVLGIDRQVEEAGERPRGRRRRRGEGDHRPSRDLSHDNVRYVRPQGRRHRPVDVRQHRPRQRRPPRHARVHQLLAVGVAEQRLDSQRLQEAARLGMQPRPVRRLDLGRRRQRARMGEQQRELAVEIVRQVLGDLLEAALELSLLGAPVALQQQAREHQRRRDQAGAEQEQQQGDAQAAARRAVVVFGCGRVR